MKQHEFLPEFEDEDVVQFCPRNKPHFTPEMMKFSRFRDAVKTFFKHNFNDVITSSLEQSKVKTYATYSEHDYHLRGQVKRSQSWLSDGIDCEILKLGSTNWQSGKIRVRVALEFVPDELAQNENCDDLPLAEIRQEIENIKV